MTLEIMEPSESQVARLAYVRLFLTVCQEMALQVVVTRKLCVAIRTLVLLSLDILSITGNCSTLSC